MELKKDHDVIAGFLQERRETEKREKMLREEIDRMRRSREAIAADHSMQKAEELKHLDERIDDLRRELDNQIDKRRNICKAARTFTAGD